MNKLLKYTNSLFVIVVYATLLFFSFVNISFSQEFNSSNFKVLDPVQTSGGGFSSSSAYQLNSSISQIGIGTSTATSSGVNSGFLYFPFVTAPIVSPTASNTSVSLIWTPATATSGLAVSGYNVGYSTVSGGPYTFSASLGNVLSNSVSGLTNGTIYYFVVRVEDTFLNIIATSSQVSSTPTGSTTPPVVVSSGGGGGGGFFQATAVSFSGFAYPKSTVTLLKDGQIVSISVANLDASFTINLPNQIAGNYNFSLYSEDDSANRSPSLSFPTSITTGVTKSITGILFSPTISVDKNQVKKGSSVVISGRSAPLADILISVLVLDKETFLKTTSDKDGAYSYSLDTTSLSLGAYILKSKVSKGNQLESSYSNTTTFNVNIGDIPVTETEKCFIRGDLNNDCRVNLIDFSIAAFWYNGVLSDRFKGIELERLSGDARVNLIDFSIIAYYWTG